MSQQNKAVPARFSLDTKINPKFVTPVKNFRVGLSRHVKGFNSPLDNSLSPNQGTSNLEASTSGKTGKADQAPPVRALGLSRKRILNASLEDKTKDTSEKKPKMEENKESTLGKIVADKKRKIEEITADTNNSAKNEVKIASKKVDEVAHTKRGRPKKDNAKNVDNTKNAAKNSSEQNKPTEDEKPKTKNLKMVEEKRSENKKETIEEKIQDKAKKINEEKDPATKLLKENEAVESEEPKTTNLKIKVKENRKKTFEKDDNIFNEPKKKDDFMRNMVKVIDEGFAKMKQNEDNNEKVKVNSYETKDGFVVKPKIKRSLSMKKSSGSSSPTAIEHPLSPKAIYENLKPCTVVLEKIPSSQSLVDLEDAVIMEMDMEYQNNSNKPADDNITEKDVIKLQNRVDEKRALLESLKRAEAYRKLHNVKDLEEVTGVWKRGCIAALNDFLPQVKPYTEDIDMKGLLQNLKVPPHLLRVNVEGELE